MFRPASIPWFLWHELRVTWRTWFQRKGPRKKRRFAVPAPLVAGIIMLLVLVFAGVPIARGLADDPLVATPVVAIIIDAALLLVFTLMMSQTLVAAVDAFYERGDLDLLLSSPISPRRILTVRALAMAVNPALLFLAIVTPFALPIAFYGHPKILGALVVVVSMALASTAIGLAVAIALFSLVGPRRTRTIAQVLAALIGAAFVIAAQIPNLIDDDDDALSGGWVQRLFSAETLPDIARWPAEAFLGSPVPLIVFTTAAVGIFFLVSQWVGGRFARDAAAASGADTTRTRKGRKTSRFGGSVTRATIVKELKMMFRDPGLISQVLLRVFYLVPLAIVILNDTGDALSIAPAIAAAAAGLLAGQLAGSVAWITLSAEDAPQLLASAPHPIGTFWRAKIAVSILVPAVLVLPMMVLLAFFEPIAAIVGAVAAAAAAVSAAMINLWLQKPSKRSDFRRSWSTGSVGANLLELLSSLAIAVAAALAVLGLVYVWIAVGVAAAILLLARRSNDIVLDRMMGNA